jgi:putative DNA primase/helicase
MKAFDIPDPTTMPDAVETAGGRLAQTQLTTSDNLCWLLDSLGISIRYNMMTGEPTLVHPAFSADEAGQERGRLLLFDMLVRMRIKGLDRIDDMLLTLSRDDPFHPMEDWLKSAAWDGVDRIAGVIAAVDTTTELWPVFLENWMVQTVAGVCGWRGGAQSLPHVLVLVGGQGVGKTRFLSGLGGGWVKSEAELHLASSSGKDHQIDALRWPIVELAELDGIFRKSDIAHMKSFISRPHDAIRSPYGRRAIQRGRVTSFCASVNDAEFLNDVSGSRRFWPVDVLRIDWSFSTDWQQLWAQAHSMWLEDPVFDLTAAEEAERVGVAESQHTVISPEVEFLAGYWEAHKDCADLMRPMNGTEILRMLGYTNPGPQTVARVKKWLADILGKQRTISGKQRAWMFPFSDFARDPSRWSHNYLTKIT